MANGYMLNLVPVGYGAAMSTIADMLVAAGWSFKASGDGLAGYSATGKIFTGTGTGALGWNNNRAWCRLADPANAREICIQHSASANVRLKCSLAAKFTGGAPSATVTPSAADERMLWGSGTDATPTMSAWFGTGVAAGNNKFHGRANGTAPYGFWLCSAITPGGAIQCGLMMDPTSGVPEDIDPMIWMVGTTGAFNTAAWGGTGTHAAGSYVASGGVNQGTFGHRDAAATLFEAWFPSGYVIGNVQNHGTQPGSYTSEAFYFGRIGGAPNPFNAKQDPLPIPYMRANVGIIAPGLKGWSTMTRWTQLLRVHAVDTLDNFNWIAIGHLWLPWDGLTVPTN